MSGGWGEGLQLLGTPLQCWFFVFLVFLTTTTTTKIKRYSVISCCYNNDPLREIFVMPILQTGKLRFRGSTCSRASRTTKSKVGLSDFGVKGQVFHHAELEISNHGSSITKEKGAGGQGSTHLSRILEHDAFSESSQGRKERERQGKCPNASSEPQPEHFSSRGKHKCNSDF